MLFLGCQARENRTRVKILAMCVAARCTDADSAKDILNGKNSRNAADFPDFARIIRYSAHIFRQQYTHAEPNAI